MCDEVAMLRAEVDNLYNIIIRLEDSLINSRKSNSIPLSRFNQECSEWSYDWNSAVTSKPF